ncbi:MAG: ferritin family protein [Krumholzibacteria bacterium]|nr:ferritin family protein [Candidatus Krumholzibacteria bacterium]
MTDDVRLCVEILEKAIAFEEEGMAFFQDRAENAPTSLERNLFNSLAKDEAGHKAYLVKMREDLLREGTVDVLPDVDEDHVLNVRKLFEDALENASDPYVAELEELEILQGALDVERRGYAMYAGAAAKVVSPRAKAMFEHLAAEEQNHFALLKNTYDYMADPEGFAGFDGNPMLDGG